MPETGRVVDEVDFIDLYLFPDGSAEASTKNGIIPINENDFKDDIDALLMECKSLSGGLAEFTLRRKTPDGKNSMYRGTKIVDSDQRDVYILRRVKSVIRSLESLGISPDLKGVLIDPKSTGLVLISGPMGGGKTTTASSVVSARLDACGGLGFVIEDPPETQLSGPVGKGRCIQVHASRHNGGYQEQIVLSLRSGAQLLMVGEIREKDTAIEVINAASAGHLLVSTIHADRISSAVERLVNISGMHPAVVADCLSIVTHQLLTPVAGTGRVRLTLSAVQIGDAERTAIKEQQYKQLDSAADQQRRALRSAPVNP